MLKGQLSRVPWPGNSWMPFTFQPAVRVLQQPQKHSHSFQLAIHTELCSTLLVSLLSICFINSFHFFFFFLSKRIYSARPYQSTEMTLDRTSSHINNSNLPYVSAFYNQNFTVILNLLVLGI